MRYRSRMPNFVRGSSAAIIATFAALFSHVVGGGEMPDPIGIGVPLLLSLMVSVLLAGRKLSLLRLSISVLVSQMLFHTLFVLGTTPTGINNDLNVVTSHQHHGAIFLQPILSEQTTTMVQGDTLMWVSHFIGAMVTIAFLYRGERALLRLLALGHQAIAWVRSRFVAPVQLSVQVAPAQLQVHETGTWTVLSQVLESTLNRRGPPATPGIAR